LPGVSITTRAPTDMRATALRPRPSARVRRRRGRRSRRRRVR
jgi:hypothetical protein